MRSIRRSGLSLLLAILTHAALIAAPQAAAPPAARPQAKAAPARKTASAAAVPGKPEKVTSVEGITEYRLSNGLRVLLFPDPTKATITVNITYQVGSRNESYGETGMAHLLEHLVFKGTPKHPNIPQELTAHGARPNGSTWFDRTNYFETFQASDENLKWALDLEADRMINSYIAKKDLDSEMTVVRNEFELGENDPASILEERVLSTAFLWHNYGHSTIGAKSDLEHVPIDRLQDFYRTFYQPDNAVLLVAGKFDEAKTLELVNQTFGRIPKPTRAAAGLLHARPDAGRRAQRHARSASATCRRSPPPTTSRRGRIPSSGAVEPARADPDGRALGPALQGARRDEEGDVGRRLLHGAARPRLRDLQRRGPPGPEPRRREEGVRPDARRRGGIGADHEGGGRARARDTPEEHRPDAEQRRPRRPEAVRVHRRRATGGSSS